MDRRLLDYLPPILREVKEFQAINSANEPEITLAWDVLNAVLANQFLETADVQGVSVWEKELKIRPKDTDTLETRKARIKAMWGLKIPYTLPWLNDWLTALCGANGHRETVENYILDIWLDYARLQNADSLIPELMGLLSQILPANLWWKRFVLSLEMKTTLRLGCAMVAVTRRLPVPELADDLRLTRSLRVGGQGWMRTTLPTPER